MGPVVEGNGSKLLPLLKRQTDSALNRSIPGNRGEPIWRVDSGNGSFQQWIRNRGIRRNCSSKQLIPPFPSIPPAYTRLRGMSDGVQTASVPKPAHFDYFGTRDPWMDR